MNIYNYKELINRVKKNPNYKNLKKLFYFFQNNNPQAWNGECFDTEKELGGSLYPVHRFVRDRIDLSQIEENSNEWNFQLEVVDFEIK